MQSRPKVQQTNFTPPPVTPTGPSEADLAFQSQLQEQLRMQQEAYKQQLTGMSDQFRAQQDNSTSLLNTLNQQLEATKAKAASDAKLLEQANAVTADQAQLVDAQRGAAQAKTLDDMAAKRGTLGLLRKRTPARRRSILNPQQGY